jgi:hypothetical protein
MIFTVLGTIILNLNWIQAQITIETGAPLTQQKQLLTQTLYNKITP